MPISHLGPTGLLYTGHVRAPNKNHLQDLSHRRHRRALQALKAFTPPPSWDSRSLGWVGPIKDQGQCGSCWDFSGTGVVEIAYYKAGVLPPDGSAALSEEYTLSCGRNGGCNGDDNTTVLQWAKQTGLPKSSDYGPYAGREQSCAYKPNMALYKVDDWGFANSSGAQGQTVTPVADIKAAIMAYGAVGCAVDASFQDPGSGVISGGGNSIDHDVILVGWDDSKGNGGAWIMRNSWGTSWGDGGYAWIEYGAYSIGTESVWAKINASAPPIDWFA